MHTHPRVHTDAALITPCYVQSVRKQGPSEATLWHERLLLSRAVDAALRDDFDTPQALKVSTPPVSGLSIVASAIYASEVTPASSCSLTHSHMHTPSRPAMRCVLRHRLCWQQ